MRATVVVHGRDYVKISDVQPPRLALVFCSIMIYDVTNIRKDLSITKRIMFVLLFLNLEVN